jgi:hypothetical protein
MNVRAVLKSLSLCLIFSAVSVFAAGPFDGAGDTSTRPGLERQDTGMSDPTVNPGQAAGTRTIHGLVLRLQDGGYVIRDAKGREASLLVDGETTGDTDLSAGDYIETNITPQGRAISILKETDENRPKDKSHK